ATLPPPAKLNTDKRAPPPPDTSATQTTPANKAPRPPARAGPPAGEGGRGVFAPPVPLADPAANRSLAAVAGQGEVLTRPAVTGARAADLRPAGSHELAVGLQDERDGGVIVTGVVGRHLAARAEARVEAPVRVVEGEREVPRRGNSASYRPRRSCRRWPLALVRSSAARRARRRLAHRHARWRGRRADRVALRSARARRSGARARGAGAQRRRRGRLGGRGTRKKASLRTDACNADGH